MSINQIKTCIQVYPDELPPMKSTEICDQVFMFTQMKLLKTNHLSLT